MNRRQNGRGRWCHHVQEMGHFGELVLLQRENACSVVDSVGWQMLVTKYECTPVWYTYPTVPRIVIISIYITTLCNLLHDFVHASAMATNIYTGGTKDCTLFSRPATNPLTWFKVALWPDFRLCIFCGSCRYSYSFLLRSKNWSWTVSVVDWKVLLGIFFCWELDVLSSDQLWFWFLGGRDTKRRKLRKEVCLSSFE